MAIVSKHVRDASYDGLGRTLELTAILHEAGKLYIGVIESDGDLSANWVGDAADIAQALNELPGWEAEYTNPEPDFPTAPGSVVRRKDPSNLTYMLGSDGSWRRLDGKAYSLHELEEFEVIWDAGKNS